MLQLFPVSPCYCLDDPSPWLEGIDPSCRYWIAVNGEPDSIAMVPGAIAASLDDFKAIIRDFRSLQPGERLRLERVAQSCVVQCVSPNCYAIETEFDGAPVWHLFDQETLDSLLLTCHPDWQCSSHDVDLWRQLLDRSLQQSVA